MSQKLLDRRKAIMEELARTQIHKHSMSHICRLKAQLARIKTELLENAAREKAGPAGDGFDVRKSGDVRVALVGFPSVGKSSFLSKVTKTESAAAAYEFTTLTCIPGKVMHNGTEIQILDLPGIIEGAAEGKGRGKQVIATARTSDCIIVMLEAAKAEAQRGKIVYELESVGLRLNERPPDMTFNRKASCSMNVVRYTATVPQTQGMSEEIAKAICQDYKIHNADVVVREDISIDRFIDVVEGNRRYIPCVFVNNKVDTITIEEVDRLARLPHNVVCSVQHDLNLPGVIEEVWEHLAINRIFTKKRREPPDFMRPFVVQKGNTVEDVCRRIHKDVLTKFKYAMVWGTSVRHQPQTVGISHVLEDEDVLQIMLRTANQTPNQPGQAGVAGKATGRQELKAAKKDDKKKGKKP